MNAVCNFMFKIEAIFRLTIIVGLNILLLEKMQTIVGKICLEIKKEIYWQMGLIKYFLN